MNSSAHIFHPLEANEDEYFPYLSSPSQTSHSSSSSIIRPTAIYPSQDQQGRYHLELLKPYQQSQEVDDYVSHGGLSGHQNLSPPSLSTLESGSEYGLKISIFEGDHHQDESPTSEKGPVCWMSSKMRLMKKMINSTDHRSMDGDQKHTSGKLWFQDQNSPCNVSDNLGSNTSAMIRTCSDCNTTRTPLWRSGPKGPKSLCNACGIRQRKARRAMEAAAATANGGVATETPSMQIAKVHCSKKKSGKAHTAPHRKQPKLGTTPSKRKNNLGFEDFIVNLSNNLSLHRVIQQDETEAAILLMALSYGLVSS